MYPYIDLGIIQIPTYITLFLVAYAIMVVWARKLGERYNYPKADILYIALYAGIGILIGAKFMYFVSKLPKIIPNFDVYIELWKNNPTEAMNYSFGGLVFYGGLIGAVVGAYIYCRQFKMPFTPLLDIFAPLIPFVHGVGRIGCFMAGCCYGIPDERFGIAFTHSLGAPNGIKLFPVQLLEAFLLFVLAAIMQIYFVKSKHRHCVIYIYLLAYPVIRIITEHFRYDNAERGIYFGLSTSTWISIAILAAGAITMILDYKKNKFNEPPEPEIILAQKN